MEARINVEVEELVAWIRELGGNSFFPDQLLARSVMNVIGSIVFGRRFGRHDTQRDSFLEDLYTFTTSLWTIMPVNRFPLLRFVPGFRGPFCRQIATHDRMMEFIRDNVRRSFADADSESFVSRYRDQSADDFDPVELDFIIRDLIVAGTETSVTSIRWALAMLANHRQVQTRVQRELDAVVPPTRLPSLDERPQLPYVDATVLELMRRRTVAPLSVPRATAADTEVNGYFIPAKTMVHGVYFRACSIVTWAYLGGGACAWALFQPTLIVNDGICAAIVIFSSSSRTSKFRHSLTIKLQHLGTSYPRPPIPGL